MLFIFYNCIFLITIKRSVLYASLNPLTLLGLISAASAAPTKIAVISKVEITAPNCAMNDNFQTHDIDFYHLDTMIVIGYRMSSTLQQIDSDFDKQVRR